MKTTRLIIDSCCDVPADIVNSSDVELISFTYELSGGIFKDDLFQTKDASEFYDAMRKGEEPTTSQLKMQTLQEVFKTAAEEGTPTVYLSFSSGLSGSYDVAMLVKEQIDVDYPDFELYVVDTKLASVAEGLLVFEAIKQFERGLSAKELADWAEEAKYFVDCEFMVEDLTALRRGGRIPGSVAVAGAALDVKPLLTIDVDGKLSLIGVARGRKTGIKQLSVYDEKNVSHEGASNVVFIGDSDCAKDLQRLREGLQKIDDSIMFVESSIGPVIGSHVGPGMLACVFWGKDKRENLTVAERIAKKVKGGK